MDIVEKLSTEIVENPDPYLVYVDIVEKLSTEIVEKIMSAEELWKKKKQSEDKLSTEIVDKSIAIKISCMKTSDPQSLWITRWKNV